MTRPEQAAAARRWPSDSTAAAWVDLVASAEPAVVFASLAAGCVPDVCDRCVIDIVEDDADGYRIVYPPSERTQAAEPPASEPDTVAAGGVSVCFNSHDAIDECGYRGTATFSWRIRPPARGDTAIVDLLVDRATQTIAWQRSEDRARAAMSKAQHLQVALHTSRQIGAAIGILMSTHKITEDAAFTLLRAASQYTHRKVRDVAIDVIDTGTIPPR